MSFLMPSLLVGLLGASIPVIIHLLNRQRTRPIRWGAMRFLRASSIRTRRRRNIERWLLMAMRILAIAVLALLLARPQSLSSKVVGTSTDHTPTDLAVVIDHSFSMERPSGGQTVFSRAIATLQNVIAQTGPNDTISVIVAEHVAHALTPLPVRSSDGAAMANLDQGLHRLKPGTTDCNIPDAINLARTQLFRGPNQSKLILVLSDQQRENWHADDEALWTAAVGDRTEPTPLDLKIDSLPLSPDAHLSAAAVRDVSIRPAVLGVNRPVQISATVLNTGTEPLNGLTARLTLDDKATGSKPVPPLGPKASATIQFDLESGFSEPGSHRVKVDLASNQAIGPDCPAYAVANVLQQLPVLIIDGQFSPAGDFLSSRFLRAAMKPSEQAVLREKIVSVSEATSLALGDYMVVVVNDVPTLPPALRDQLAEYARSGHGVWFILGPRTQETLLDRDLPQAGFLHCDPAGIIDASNPNGALAIKDPVNPMVAMIARTDQNPLAGVLTERWWSVRPADPDTQIIVAAPNGDPLVLQRPYGAAGGMVVVWATSADGAWNNWQLMPNFVPLVNETVYHLASAQLHGLANRGLDAGQPLEWAGHSSVPIRSVTVARPDGTSVEHPATFNDGRWVVTDSDTFVPGFYRFTFDPHEVPPVSYGVNVDPKELQPAALEATDIARLVRRRFIDGTITPAEFAGLFRHGTHTREYRNWLAAILLLFLLLETLLTWRLMRLQTSDSIAQEPAPAEALVGMNSGV